MMYLSQSHPDKRTVVLNVEGDLDRESLPDVRDAYRESVGSGKRVAINLANISGVDRHGKAFLRQIRDAVQFVGLPGYLKLEIDD